MCRDLRMSTSNEFDRARIRELKSIEQCKIVQPKL